MDFEKTTTGLENKTRLAVAENLSQYKTNLVRGLSERNAAHKMGIPHDTLRYWKNRANKIPLPKATVDFFES